MSESDPETRNETRKEYDPEANIDRTRVPVDERDWELREVGDSYPLESNYFLDSSNKVHSTHLREIKEAVDESEDLSWGEFIRDSKIHRCTGCGEPLDSLTELYCKECSIRSDDWIPCRNCGSERVTVSDPFCCAECASEFMDAVDEMRDPLAPPVNPSKEWLKHPHRTRDGIPSSASLIENNTYVCRECFEYGSDSLHSFAVHVAEKHEMSWSEYVKKYGLRECRVCGVRLDSLRPVFSDEELENTSNTELGKCCEYNNCGGVSHSG